MMHRKIRAAERPRHGRSAARIRYGMVCDIFRSGLIRRDLMQKYHGQAL